MEFYKSNGLNIHLIGSQLQTILHDLYIYHNILKIRPEVKYYLI